MKFHLIDCSSDEPLGGALEKTIKRMGALAVDFYFREEREGDVVFFVAKLLDLGLAAGLLTPELVAGKTEHDEPTLAILTIQRFQPLILRREAASAGDIDDKHHLACESSDFFGFAVDGLQFNVVDRVHKASVCEIFRGVPRLKV